jgi:hypothetical protein
VDDDDALLEEEAIEPEEDWKLAPVDDLNPSVSATGLSDAPSERDEIGFSPYVRAVSRFLCDPNTKPPLTMSVEGRWGAGKSSFLLQLASQLRSPAGGKAESGKLSIRSVYTAAREFLLDVLGKNKVPDENHRYTIWFNAWRSDKDEALWASFALIFMRQLGRQIPAGRRLRANVTLLVKRFDFDRSKLQFLQILLFLLSVALFIVIGVMHPEELHRTIGKPLTDVTTGFSAITLIGWGIARAKKLFGNPLSHDLAKYIRNPRYEDKVSFIDRFQEDFTRILQSYVGSGRVYVFIDDLDRCEVPRAADLMQAINLLLSADQPSPDPAGILRRPEANLFFLMGLDRKVVAAGIAAKNEKILPYIVSGQLPSGSTVGDLNRAGLDYGYEFLEKFIQIPFRVPEIDSQHNKEWVSRLTSITDEKSGAQKPTPEQSERGIGLEEANPVFEIGADPEEFGDIVDEITSKLQFNPRRVKQFINVFRLQVLILIETGVLRSAEGGRASAGTEETLTLERIGLVVGIFLRWPGIVADVLDNPSLLLNLRESGNYSTTDAPTTLDNGVVSTTYDFWIKEKRLIAALSLGERYTLSNAAIRHILDLVPDAYKGTLRWGSGGGRPARLVGSSQSANYGTPISSAEAISTAANFANSVAGPTGSAGPTPPSSLA